MARWLHTIAGMALLCWAQAAQAQLSNPIPYTPPSPAAQIALGEDAARLLAQPPLTLEGETDLACTAVAVYHESRGENIQGQRAVASVVLQRTMVPDRWGARPCDVVRPVQFTFMTGRWTYPPIYDRQAWETALRVALTIFYQGPDAELMGADHYHTHDVFPEWRNHMDLVAMIGEHRFYVDPISVRKTAEAGIAGPQMILATSNGPTVVHTPAATRYDWASEGTPVAVPADGVRGMAPNATLDLYAQAQAPATQPPTVGGFEPIRGPEVDAIARAQVATGTRMGIAAGPIAVAAAGFKPLGMSRATP